MAKTAQMLSHKLVNRICGEDKNDHERITSTCQSDNENNVDFAP